MKKMIKASLSAGSFNTDILALVRIAIGTTFFYHSLVL